ncbi:lactate/malate family dehydrogenase [Roseateles cellulosilyticus]|uniref:L-lactate dehydrogenase n=1 Tax=Pelomonas cellulosilytica TaxID=2906762 RepID=A0ABS8XZ24_9BURK|nr:L-lactate dehydrogenase [Pelomonas sp. P8]MCE4557228.1 L-lactate dehydrogenase [Pelomonas sp. P8]
MKARIGIIGTGWVGTSVAFSTLLAGHARELWLYDQRGAVAEGEALDMADGAAFYPRCQVSAVPLAQMREADIVVLAAGRNGRPDESRLDLLRDNARIAAGLGRSLAGFGGIVIVVTNPVDVLTRVVTAASGLPPERVIGTGTLLDSARLRERLAMHLSVSPQSVHAQVVGEHGDSSVMLWSSAHVGGVPLRVWPGWPVDEEPTVAGHVRRAAYDVIQRKGATNHAIGLVTTELIGCIVNDERRLLPVSRVQTGACGVRGVALSLPALVGSSGAAQVLEPAMDDAEAQALAASAAVLDGAFKSLAG